VRNILEGVSGTDPGFSNWIEKMMLKELQAYRELKP
jgi:hypothetical protein